MTDIYNMTSLQESRTIIEIVSWANSQVSSLLFVVLVFALFVLILVIGLQRTVNKVNAFIAASFITGLVSVFLVDMGVLNIWYMVVFIGVLVVSLFIRLVSK